MGDMESFSAPRAFTASDSPNDPPMAKLIVLSPERANCASFLENAGEERACPSMHIGISTPPAFLKIRCPSSSSPFDLCGGGGVGQAVFRQLADFRFAESA